MTEAKVRQELEKAENRQRAPTLYNHLQDINKALPVLYILLPVTLAAAMIISQVQVTTRARDLVGKWNLR